VRVRELKVKLYSICMVWTWSRQCGRVIHDADIRIALEQLLSPALAMPRQGPLRAPRWVSNDAAPAETPLVQGVRRGVSTGARRLAVFPGFLAARECLHTP
jgi:hypothetical protein